MQVNSVLLMRFICNVCFEILDARIFFLFREFRAFLI